MEPKEKILTINAVDFLVKTGICSSKREAKEMLASGAIRINTVKINGNFNLKL
jgi:tyrosyl-tRNA synthetase